MKLERFKEKDKKKIGIIIFTVCCILLIGGVFLYKTFALFEEKSNLNMIEGQVQDVGDLYFSFYVNGVISKAMPTKDSGYILDNVKTNCSNGASAALDEEDWRIKIFNMTTSRTKCNVFFKTPGTDSILNGADPVITGSLIPINLANDGAVTKADTTQEWYNYSNKEWANAIILKDESITYNNGDIIPESNIESYFVWIPRYRYKIFDSGDYPTRGSVNNTKVETIEVEFETKDVPKSNGSKVGEWLTHPAFISFDSNGMWVGKYETGTTLTSNYNIRSGDAVQIKPNVSSWRGIQVANAFYSSYDYKRDLESHMMKNTEWGAVAYLQHSAYGSQQSVRINNNSSYVTGYAANTEPTCGYTATNEECNVYCSNGSCNQPYNTETGYLASTTANITGIYDMSGGAWEYVMGIMTDQNGTPLSGRNSTSNSGFNGPLGCPTCDSDTSGLTSVTDGLPWPETKYYDSYIYSTSDQQYNRRILGDATGEMGPFGTSTYIASNGTSQSRSIGSWYDDYAYFVSSTGPWFLRGYAHFSGYYAGVFAFLNANGYATSTLSFRVVLTP